jgi:hypothetical protein
VAPRGYRHGFSNPTAEAVLVLGIWAPPEPALAFMREIGAALAPGIPPDPERMRDIYARHASRLLRPERRGAGVRARARTHGVPQQSQASRRCG